MYVCVYVRSKSPEPVKPGLPNLACTTPGGVDCHAPLEIFFGPPLGGATVVTPPLSNGK